MLFMRFCVFYMCACNGINAAIYSEYIKHNFSFRIFRSPSLYTNDIYTWKLSCFCCRASQPTSHPELPVDAIHCIQLARNILGARVARWKFMRCVCVWHVGFRRRFDWNVYGFFSFALVIFCHCVQFMCTRLNCRRTQIIIGEWKLEQCCQLRSFKKKTTQPRLRFSLMAFL